MVEQRPAEIADGHGTRRTRTDSDGQHAGLAVGQVYSFALIESHALLPHEEVDKLRLGQLTQDIARDGALRVPIMVDRRSMVILDGHHRVQALRLLGCRLIPAYLVDYKHPSIVVKQWRPDTPVDKDSVVQAGLTGHPYPPKVSRHVWGQVPEEHPVPLSLLHELGSTGSPRGGTGSLTGGTGSLTGGSV